MLLQDSLYVPSSNKHSSSPLLLIEHDLTRSPLPFLRHLIAHTIASTPSGHKEMVVVLNSFQHRADVLVRDLEKEVSTGKLLVTCDRFTNGKPTGTGSSSAKEMDLRELFMKAIHDKVPTSHGILFLIDSVDVMAFELGRKRTLSLLFDLVETLKSRHPNGDQNDGTANMMKFYKVFAPFTQRERNEVERVVFQSGSNIRQYESESVVEVVRRTSNLRKGVERSLEGIKSWNTGEGGLEICPLGRLDSLEGCFKRKEGDGTTSAVEGGDPNRPDPTQNLPFNLGLTEEQQASRARVPLPYAHTGEDGGKAQNIHDEKDGSGKQAVIYYDPDSADDLDDEDPDEDLDL
ncbi:hypothetical protein FRC17_004935 [Serendipita sp. 399]|nr:hypothetical protein FRC17_004935 [Serendipita sp. 399]